MSDSDTEMVITARQVARRFGNFMALDHVSFDVPLGRIVGVIGANGAGKTTLLNAVLGLAGFEGDLKVLGFDPSKQRQQLMQHVCFISDVATLPKWMKVHQVLDYVEDIHPKFDRAKAEDYLSRTSVPLGRRVKALSKGMTVQVHLAVVMSIDAKLLVLDEPTLGLDIMFRKEFYRQLLDDYFDEDRTIIITTHQVEEVEHILSDVIFIRDGKIALQDDMESLGERFCELMVTKGNEEAAQALGPIDSNTAFGRQTFVYENVAAEKLKPLGEVRRLGLADVFVVTMGDANSNRQH